MKIDIITLFPEFFDSLIGHSIVGRAIKSNKIELVVHNLRDWAVGSYQAVDDRPYGGGPGMVLRVDVLHRALQDIKTQSSDHSLAQGSELSESKVILLTPQGQPYKQKMAEQLSHETNLILICGHYEGFDERIREYVDMELSVGDYILTGGEIPAMTIVDSVARLLPGVLGDDASSHDESFADGLLEYPQYTRPEEYEGVKVPEILLSGHHKLINVWRRAQAIEKTKAVRGDLISKKLEVDQAKNNQD